jgi:hypothetical protein
MCPRYIHSAWWTLEQTFDEHLSKSNFFMHIVLGMCIDAHLGKSTKVEPKQMGISHLGGGRSSGQGQILDGQGRGRVVDRARIRDDRSWVWLGLGLQAPETWSWGRRRAWDNDTGDEPGRAHARGPRTSWGWWLAVASAGGDRQWWGWLRQRRDATWWRQQAACED